MPSVDKECCDLFFFHHDNDIVKSKSICTKQKAVAKLISGYYKHSSCYLHPSLSSYSSGHSTCGGCLCNVQVLSTINKSSMSS